jgi:Tfp pilus assembly protein PilP
MKTISMLSVIILLSACATSSDQHITDAVADFIQVAELTPEASIRTRRGYNYTVISERYVVLKSHNDYYLAEFTRDCRELHEQHRVSPDYRHDANVLHARFDTIRGCRIAKLYPIEEWQAEELKTLGDAPGD